MKLDHFPPTRARAIRAIRSAFGFALALIAAAAPRPSSAQAPDFERRYADLVKNSEGLDDAARLKRLFDLSWEYTMVNFPESATYRGWPGQNHRWTDDSLDAIERRKRERAWPRSVLEKIDREKLSAEDQLNYDLYKRNLDLAFEGDRFPEELMPVTQMGGVQQDVAEMLGSTQPAKGVKDYEDILARMKAVPALVDQTIALMEKGLEKGITPPKITLRDVPQQVKNQISDDPEKAPVLRAFLRFPSEVSKDDQARLTKQAIGIYKERVVPAFAKLAKFMEEKYVPGARESIACSALPDGEAWYSHRARVSTTTDLSPKQIHDLGQAEVKRIRTEMDRVIAETEFKGTFEEFTNFLRTDPQFFFTDAKQLLAEYRDIAKRIDPELPRLFGRLPRLPYGVREIPSFAAPSQTTAYYMGGSPEAGRPGYFYANTYDLKSRPKWEMEALTVHEAVPGHHLQISLAQEMGELPEFRRYGGPTAFVEGWGLYSESLGGEIGLYQDPYSKFGQLTYEMWRAVRLVVDTGMHSLGWSRDEAIEFFVKNSGKARHDIVVEIDRYIVWPGQALAYKIGELKMKDLRRRAREELGDRFDIREFHDRLLEAGAIPMETLEKRMAAWIERKKKG